MDLLVYCASTGSRSQEHFVDVFVCSNLLFFLISPSLARSDGSFLPTTSSLLSVISLLLSMEFDTSSFSALRKLKLALSLPLILR